MSAPLAANVPKLIYGTAWKQLHTTDLVHQAILHGFRAIDTAAQPKHYQEHLVGAGIRAALKDGIVERKDLYVQTKYTSVQGQDLNKIPYDPSSSIADQVHTSVATSLRNLKHSEDGMEEHAYLDCLVLHSPLPSVTKTQEAWRAMELHVPHAVKTLGISNCYDLPTLQALYESATVKPTVIQNRFYDETGYDRGIRAFCDVKGIVYQSFWTLTANPQLLKSEPVRIIAEQANVSKPVALYGLVLGLGNTRVLNGTTNSSRMKEDLAGVEAVQAWSIECAASWNAALKAFDRLLQ